MSEPETRVRACCVFHGRVQGVFFRAHTEAYAVSAHLTGWVRNLPDGTVEALFEGRKEDILAVIHRCRYDQPHAKVTDIDLEWCKATGEFHSFSIHR